MYNRYKRAKKSLDSLDYRGYPISSVAGSFIAKLIWEPSLYLFLHYLTANVKGVFNSVSQCDSNLRLITYTRNRAEYRDLIEGYFPGSSPLMICVDEKISINFCVLPDVFKSLVKAICLCGFPSRNYFIKVVSVSFAIRLIDEVEKIDCNCKMYVAFNSSYLCESVLSWFFRLRGVKTVSLQHGFYVRYNDPIPLDIINYENVCAEEFWLWGKYSYEQIKHLTPSSSRLVIAGYPYIEEKKGVVSVPSIYVLLPRSVYLKESISLLELLKNTPKEYHFVVRPHPRDKAKVESWLEAAGDSFSICKERSLNKVLFKKHYKKVVVFNSTAIFDSIRAGQDVVVFAKNEEFDTFNIPKFTTLDGFLALMTQSGDTPYIDDYYSPYRGKGFEACS